MSGTSEQPKERERRRQTRTPVDINALLIGEKTVPKGCRVINVSQYGMLLYCEADGRLSTFNDGDNVDIHLTVQHAGKQKKLTIPSYVRRVADNSVDVEFHHPDPILMDLIESYRVSDEHRLEASLGQNHSHPGNIPRPAAGGKASRKQPAPEPQVPVAAPAPQKAFFRGLLFLLFTLCVAGGGYVYTASIENRISSLESTTRNQTTDLEQLHRIYTSSLQGGRNAMKLDARVTSLSEAFARIERKITQLVPQGSAPGAATPGNTAAAPLPPRQTAATAAPTSPKVAHPPAAVSPAVPVQPAAKLTLSSDRPSLTADAGSEPARRTRDEARDRAMNRTAQKVAGVSQPPQEQPPAAAGKPAGATSTPAKTSTATAAKRSLAAEQEHTGTPPAQQPSPRDNGPWMINLASSPSRADIARLQEVARSTGISTMIEQAEVKGRQYWRLQTGGYPSLAAARKAAEPVKAALSLDTVWYLKKK